MDILTIGLRHLPKQIKVLKYHDQPTRVDVSFTSVKIYTKYVDIDFLSIF